MKTNRAQWAAVVLCTTLLTACNGGSGDSLVDHSNTSAEISAEVLDVTATDANPVTSERMVFDPEDVYTDWEGAQPVKIELSGNGAVIDGEGAIAIGGQVTIQAAGIYVLSGVLTEGQILVNSQEEGTVRVVLNGVTLTSSTNAPIDIQSAEKVILSLEAGTENVITDGESYVLADGADEPNAAIYSKEDLVINGTGTLIVNGNYNNGITSKDALRIVEGTLVVNAVDDGIIGKNKVLVQGADITIVAGGDGIKSTNSEDTTKGYVGITGGTFNITAGNDAIQAETSILIEAGEFTLSTGGGSINSSHPAGGEQGQRNPWGDQQAISTQEDTPSAKAIKAVSDITIKGGTYTIDASDDALHSDNSLTVTGGTFVIETGDDGIHADETISIQGGDIRISKSYEGVESPVVGISGGEIHVIASDDGINIAGANDPSMPQGQPGKMTTAQVSDNKAVITGGYINVNAGGDGIDVNGSFYMTNGTVLVSGPTDDGNAPLDYDGVCQVTGGFMVCAGSAGMAMAPSEDSTQGSLLMYYLDTQKAGTLLHLEDKEGNTLVTFAPAKEYASIVISSPELVKGGTYTLYSGGTANGVSKDGFYTDGTYKDGSKVVEFTTKDITTYLSETGITTQREGFPGGGMMPGEGGKRQPPVRQKP